MKTTAMLSHSGKPVPNQLIISGEGKEIFKSYDTIIAIKDSKGIILDADKWDYSTTTGKYRNMFLGETKKETERKIKSGEYRLENLNQ